MKASTRDSGVYKCSYGSLSADRVTVHIIAGNGVPFAVSQPVNEILSLGLSGENSAAMQHDAVSEETSAVGALLPSIFVFLIALLTFTNDLTMGLNQSAR